MLPAYACAILRCASTGALFVEERGADAPVAPSRLTCFGGKRELDETPLDAVRRELVEEMGWRPQALRQVVNLWVDDTLVAYFFEGDAPPRDFSLVFEPNRRGLWFASVDELLADSRLSAWHASVLRAWVRGDARADYP